jgi:hypothetical protein
MAATAWPFGLDHFSHNENLWWPILVGIVLLAAYWALAGVVFVALADRTYRVSHPAAAVLAGAAWSFVTFIFSWYDGSSPDRVPERMRGSSATSSIRPMGTGQPVRELGGNRHAPRRPR